MKLKDRVPQQTAYLNCQENFPVLKERYQTAEIAITMVCSQRIFQTNLFKLPNHSAQSEQQYQYHGNSFVQLFL